MSCFWVGINTKLKLGLAPAKLIEHLKKNNRKTNITWKSGGEELTLTDKQKEENKEAISCLKLENGYLCSTFDPVLFLVAEIYEVNIIHKYNGVRIEYVHPKSDKTVNFNSSKSHFS